MQNKLTEERLQQMEKELCVEQAATDDKYNECFQLIVAARRGLMSQSNEIAKPKPTHFIAKEGEPWVLWQDWPKRQNLTAHVIKFDDGSIFDMVNGWRSYTADGKCDVDTERRVPRYSVKDLAEPFPKTSAARDYRIVARGLLEHCLGVLEHVEDNHLLQYFEERRKYCKFAIVQLKAALATEKKELKAP